MTLLSDMLPYFYISSYEKGQPEIVLDEDNSRHIVQVLRMSAGDPLRLTDGKGALLEGLILDAHKKKCVVQVQHSGEHPAPEQKTGIAISLLKNAPRFEWFLEKATEIGVSAIIPLLCERTEKQHFRQDRMQNILVSAMLQSQQAWLPDLHTPTAFAQVAEHARQEQRFIAHCLEEERSPLADISAGRDRASAGSDRIILIGPEGDFSRKEIGLALQYKFLPVTLGSTRLRTETAGIVAATLLQTR
jgi:16S rRNA (uracil1498-N3)-methyltransferase